MMAQHGTQLLPRMPMTLSVTAVWRGGGGLEVESELSLRDSCDHTATEDIGTSPLGRTLVSRGALAQSGRVCAGPVCFPRPRSLGVTTKHSREANQMRFFPLVVAAAAAALLQMS